MNLTRDKFIPYVNANALRKFLGMDTVGEGYDWVRIDKSTIFELTFNAQEQTDGFIDSANDTSYTKSFQLTLPQEIILDSENPLFELMFPYAMHLPTGASAIVESLLAVPNLATGEPTNAILWNENVISPSTLNTQDGKLTWDMKLNGTPSYGTVVMGTDYKPEFTSGDWSYDDGTKPEVTSYSAKSNKTNSED